MAGAINIPNETGQRVVLYGTETIAGQAVVPSGMLLGEFSATKSRPVRRREEATGGYDRLVSPTRETPTFDGTYGENLTYESFPALLQLGVKGGLAPVSDANTVPGYTWTASPSFATDDIDSATVYSNVEGMLFQSTGVRFNSWTLAADSTDQDDAWKWSGPLFLRDLDRVPGQEVVTATGGTVNTVTNTGSSWTIDEWQGGWAFIDYGSFIGPVREIESNTADTITLASPDLGTAVTAGAVVLLVPPMPAIAVPSQEVIQLTGTKLFLDRYNASASSVGTTDISDRILSFNLTNDLSLAQKKRFSGIIARVGRGARWITGTIRFEADRWDEYKAWEEDDFLSIRMAQTGSVIDATAGSTKSATVDVEKAIFDVITPDTDNNNLTHSVTFLALYESPIETFAVKNALAALA
jgi:hypothetical protein